MFPSTPYQTTFMNFRSQGWRCGTNVVGWKGHPQDYVWLWVRCAWSWGCDPVSSRLFVLINKYQINHHHHHHHHHNTVERYDEENSIN